MERDDLKQIIESLLFVTDQPLPAENFRSILGENAKGHDVEEIIKEIGEDYSKRNSPIEVRFIANGWQFSTKKEYASWVKRLYRERTTLKLSNSALETLSIVAYKQPLTRAEVEEIRGVEATGVLETLLERKLIHIIGRKETLGRPLLYGTTNDFLKHFGLAHLSELPSIEEFAQNLQDQKEEPQLSFEDLETKTDQPVPEEGTNTPS